MNSVDIAIVGSGIAGLVAANYAARAGRRVVLYERSERLGGRAQTTQHNGFQMNLGPHALYASGANAAILAELGIALSGRRPAASRFRAIRAGHLYTLPTSALTLASTRLFGLRDKVEFGRVLASLGDIEPELLDDVPLSEWVASNVSSPLVRSAFAAIARVATYVNAPELLSAGAVVRQLRLPGGVRYLDGGWDSIVEALRDRAIKAGVAIHVSSPVRRVVMEGSRVAGVEFDGGTVESASAVVVATPPGVAAALTGFPQVKDWALRAIPSRAAVLDLAIGGLPQPGMVFALGIDHPIYFSVHSAWAQLAPDGQHVVHLMKYLPPEVGGEEDDERELEAAMDVLQPGWRGRVVHRRFLPDMVVAAWMPVAASHGLVGRPGPEIPGVHGLFVAGDWIGPEGMLADAAFASGKRAAALAVSATMVELASA